jgi:sigma-B regulation protein RsbU (phosphoserine phosphatase)
LAILLIIFVGYYYIKNGIYPLKQLTKVAQDIAKGKFDTPVPEMKHNDEISQLRDSIEEMQYKISNHADNGRKL